MSLEDGFIEIGPTFRRTGEFYLRELRKLVYNKGTVVKAEWADSHARGTNIEA